MKFVIVGGGGYIGYHVGQDLTSKGHSVLLFDVNEPHSEWFKNEISLTFVKGSLLDNKLLQQVFDNVDCVIHTASYGMSGMEQLDQDKTEEINITGTSNVIRACVLAGVRALVYTSTFNVVFGGQVIQNGTEELPYFPLHRHVDHYSRTKAVAEQLVLMADQKGPLRTTALRLAGVIGLKEKRHLPRIVNTLKFLKFTYGPRDSLVQFISLDNVVQAHVKAAIGLLRKDKVDLIGSQPFFVSDGVAINNFEFFRPLVVGLGYSYPSLNLPFWMIMIYAKLSVFMVLKLRLRFLPLLTPAEILKSAVTHHFSNEKARKILDYEPLRPNDLTEVVQYYKGKLGNSEERTNYSFMILIIFIGILIILFWNV